MSIIFAPEIVTESIEQDTVMKPRELKRGDKVIAVKSNTKHELTVERIGRDYVVMSDWCSYWTTSEHHRTGEQFNRPNDYLILD